MSRTRVGKGKSMIRKWQTQLSALFIVSLLAAGCGVNPALGTCRKGDHVRRNVSLDTCMSWCAGFRQGLAEMAWNPCRYTPNLET